MLERASATIERIAIFRPGIVGPWLLWPLAALVLVGIPAGAVWAWQRGLAAEEARMTASASEGDLRARRQEREIAGDAARLDGGGDPKRAAEAGPHDERRA
jgi:hypothetical protein